MSHRRSTDPLRTPAVRRAAGSVSMSPVSSTHARRPPRSGAVSTRMTSDRSLSRRDLHPASGQSTVHLDAPTMKLSPAAMIERRVP